MHRRGESNGPDHRVPGNGTPVQVRVAKWGDRWRVVVGAGSGKGRRRVTTCPTRDDADAVAAAIVAQVEGGALLATEEGRAPGRVGDLLDRFCEAKAEDKRLRPYTIKAYRGRSKALKVRMGEVPLHSLTRRVVERFVRDRIGDGAAASTTATDIRTLRTALRWAAKRGWWRGPNPTDLVSGIDCGESVPRRALTMAEIAAFRTAIHVPEFRLAFEIGIQAGLRGGEIISRRWGDWDRERRTLLVCNVPRIDFKTKSKKPRVVPLTPDLNRRLMEHWMRKGQPGPDAWLLTTSFKERFVGLDRFEQHMKAACEDSGVQRVPFHTTRHTCGSLLIEAGVDLVTVSRILGHSSTAITEKVYIHVHAHQLAAAGDRLGAFMDGRGCAGSPANGPATATDRALQVLAT